MYFFAYIIYSASHNLYYFGHTNNLDDRLLRHNNNRNRFTKHKGPWQLIESLKCSSRAEAYRIELKLKAIKNPQKAIRLMKSLAQSIPT